VLLSIAAVTMSCALLITVASLFTGFIEAIENSANDHMGDIVIGAPLSLRIPKYDQLIRDLEQNQLIKGATAVLSGQGLLHMGKDTGDVRAVRIWGIEPARRENVAPFADLLVKHKGEIEPPTFAVAGDTEQLAGFVAIGVVAKPDDVTDEYDLEQVTASIGRKVVLTTGTRELKARTIKFAIADVVFSGIYEFDKDFVYLPIDVLTEKLYPLEGKVADMIQIRLNPNVEPQGALAVVRGIWRNFADRELGWSNWLVELCHIPYNNQHLQTDAGKAYRRIQKADGHAHADIRRDKRGCGPAHILHILFDSNDKAKGYCRGKKLRSEFGGSWAVICGVWIYNRPYRLGPRCCYRILIHKERQLHRAIDKYCIRPEAVEKQHIHVYPNTKPGALGLGDLDWACCSFGRHYRCGDTGYCRSQSKAREDIEV
jgi:hypothetical protein